ncbi:MAG: type IV secretory system conjugative DNA transfer family protein [Clostridiales bacterium]|nr:type IV secretory system conjugative DNA transfer family protein [Clostridiales bacterium]
MKAVKKYISYAAVGLVLGLVLGWLINCAAYHLPEAVSTGKYRNMFDISLFLNINTYLMGLAVFAVFVVLFLVFGESNAKKAKKLMNTNRVNQVYAGLEDSRFMNSKERDNNFPSYNFSRLADSRKDGVPVRAFYDKKAGLKVNIASPMHGIIIGSTGSGKTTTFINPMIQILAASGAGSSRIMTDPKGELYQLHSGFLKERGYNVMVLDLRDTYSSFRWNPLGDIYDRYQQYIEAGANIFEHTDPIDSYDNLKLLNDKEAYGETWYEYYGSAYADADELIIDAKLKKQQIYDELYEDLNDLISVLCPIESSDDPVWEKGARSIVMATALAMLEDSENPELGMTKERYNFYNLNKAISNSDNNFEALKNYFAGRSPIARCVSLSKQVTTAAENTLSSYMSIAFDKMSMFNDEGICALTSGTDIDPNVFADEKTALFMKIPDEKDTRHALASMFVLCIYKALIKKASAREDLSLPRNVYFILDEFGNMPKIDKFDKMITVGRSRKIWFNMVVQSYAQLNNVYGDTVADIIKSNCGMKMFIGSNDINTCKEFSELCGNMTVQTGSVSGSVSGDKDISYSHQIQQRPLIYPSELQRLNNKESTGNSIIVTFGNYPLKTKFTPSYRCPVYKFFEMDNSENRKNPFFGEDVYYDLGERNNIVLAEMEAEKAETEV